MASSDSQTFYRHAANALYSAKATYNQYQKVIPEHARSSHFGTVKYAFENRNHRWGGIGPHDFGAQVFRNPVQSSKLIYHASQTNNHLDAMAKRANSTLEHINSNPVTRYGFDHF